VARIPALYGEFGYGPLEERLPAWMLEDHVLEIALWQWLALMARESAPRRKRCAPGGKEANFRYPTSQRNPRPRSTTA
jgi:hypothetical protein